MELGVGVEEVDPVQGGSHSSHILDSVGEVCVEEEGEDKGEEGLAVQILAHYQDLK